MMRSLTVVGLLVVAISPAIAQPPKTYDATAADVKTLQGKWKLVGMAEGKDKLSKEAVEKQGMEFSVRDNGGAISQPGKPVRRMSLTLNAAVTPKQLDLLLVDEKGKPARVPVYRYKVTSLEYLGEKDAVPAKCLYELNGDELRICMPSEDTAPRPKTLDEWKRNGKLSLMVFRRVKD